MKIAVGMTCVMNQRIDQRRSTFLSAIAAGFSRVDWSYDYLNDPVRENLGPYGNFRKCLRILLNCQKSADLLLVLQDDIQIALNLKAWLQQSVFFEQNILKNPKTGAINLYCAGAHDPLELGWFKLQGGGRKSYGALSLMLPRDKAEQFVRDAPNSDNKTRTCFWLAEWCVANGYDYWHHYPSFVKHLGEKSLVDARFDEDMNNGLVRRFRQAGLFVPDMAQPVVVEDLRV